VATVLIADIIKQEGIWKHGQDTANSLLVINVLLVKSGLHRRRGKKTVKAGLFRLLTGGIERKAVGAEQSCNRTVSGFNLLDKTGLVLDLLFNGIAPETMSVMVMELVVDHLACQLVRRHGQARLAATDRGQKKDCAGY